MTSTGHCNSCSRYRWRRTMSRMRGSISTHTSTSLPSCCLPRETEPKRRNVRTPNCVRSSSEWALIRSMYSLVVFICFDADLILCYLARRP